MFSNGGISSEIVVLSKQKDQIMMNQDNIYETGVRLYFDITKIRHIDDCYFLGEKQNSKHYFISAKLRRK